MKTTFKIAATVILLSTAFTSVQAVEMPTELRETALRRRDRFAKIESLQKQGVLGESKQGLLALRDDKRTDLAPFVDQENVDREFTYAEVAKLDKTSTNDARHVFALRFRNQAPVGTPIENDKGVWETR